MVLEISDMFSQDMHTLRTKGSKETGKEERIEGMTEKKEEG